jgi:hypothetical protein
MHQHVKVTPKPPSAMAKGGKISPPLESVVLRALAKTPDGRPATMEEFARDLEAALRTPPPPPWWRRAAQVISVRLVAFMLAFGSGGRQLFRAIGSGAWRSMKASTKVIKSGARRTATGGRQLVRALLAPPLYLGKIVRRICRALIATRRRRVVVGLAALVIGSVLLAVMSPQLWSAVIKARSLSSDRSKIKALHHSSSSHSSARGH